MSEAQPLHHQAFVYLRGVYGDDPRLVDLPQETAVDLYRISSIGFRDEGAHPSIYMGVATAVTAEYVQGTPPEELLEQLGGRNKDVSHVRPLVAELAMRVVSVYRGVYGDDPRLPVYGERPNRGPDSTETQLPPAEQNRLFDILREEETQRTLREKQTGEPQEPSAISMVCHGRIVASIVRITEGVVQAHGSTLGHEKVDQIARQAVATAVWDYARLSDGQEFLPFVEGAIEQALQKEIDEQQSFLISAGQFAKIHSRLGSPEARQEPPNSQAQYYTRKVFGEDIVIHEEMTQYDAEFLLGATFRSIYKEHWHRRHQDALLTVEVTQAYVKGISPEEIVERFKLANHSVEYYVDDLAERVRASFKERNEREIALSDFWKPFSERVHDYLPHMLHFAIRLGSDTRAATLSPEDAVNEAIVKVLGRVRKAKASGEATPFLSLNYFTATLQRIYADHAKSAQARTTEPFADMTPFDTAIEDERFDRLERQERQQAIAAALAKITSKLEKHPQRELLWAAWAGKSMQELAGKYAMSVTAVKGVIYRARLMLREMVEEGEIELPPGFYSKEVVVGGEVVPLTDAEIFSQLHQLGHVSAQIIRLRNGLEDGTKWSQSRVAQSLGLTIQAVKHRERRGMEKLRQLAARQK